VSYERLSSSSNALTRSLPIRSVDRAARVGADQRFGVSADDEGRLVDTAQQSPGFSKRTDPVPMVEILRVPKRHHDPAPRLDRSLEPVEAVRLGARLEMIAGRVETVLDYDLPGEPAHAGTGIDPLDQAVHLLERRCLEQIPHAADVRFRHIVWHAPDAVGLVEHVDLAHLILDRRQILAVAGGEPGRDEQVDLRPPQPPKHLFMRGGGALDAVAVAGQHLLDHAGARVVEGKLDVTDPDRTRHDTGSSICRVNGPWAAASGRG
jgi:hypothetical protein